MSVYTKETFRGARICDPQKLLCEGVKLQEENQTDNADHETLLIRLVENGGRPACASRWRAAFLGDHPALEATIYVYSYPASDTMVRVWCFYHLQSNRDIRQYFDLLDQPLTYSSSNRIIGTILGYFCPTDAGFKHYEYGVCWMCDDAVLYDEAFDPNVVSDTQLLAHVAKLQKAMGNSFKIWHRLSDSSKGTCDRCQKTGLMAVGSRHKRWCSKKCYDERDASSVNLLDLPLVFAFLFINVLFVWRRA